MDEKDGKRITELAHLNPLLGHEQSDKLLKRMKTWNLFPNMAKVAANVVAACGKCFSQNINLNQKVLHQIIKKKFFTKHVYLSK